MNVNIYSLILKEKGRRKENISRRADFKKKHDIHAHPHRNRHIFNTRSTAPLAWTAAFHRNCLPDKIPKLGQIRIGKQARFHREIRLLGSYRKNLFWTWCFQSTHTPGRLFPLIMLHCQLIDWKLYQKQKYYHKGTNIFRTALRMKQVFKDYGMPSTPYCHFLNAKIKINNNTSHFDQAHGSIEINTMFLYNDNIWLGNCSIICHKMMGKSEIQKCLKETDI